MVPAGQKIAFDFSGTAGGWIPTTVDDVRSDIAAELSGAFRVDNLEVSNVGAIYEMLEWPFVGRMEVTPIQGFANMDDARSVVVHAIYESTGTMPTVTDAGGGWTPAAGGDWLSGITGGLGNVLSGLHDTTNLLLVLTAGVLVALVVSAGGKTTRIGLG